MKSRFEPPRVEGTVATEVSTLEHVRAGAPKRFAGSRCFRILSTVALVAALHPAQAFANVFCDALRAIVAEGPSFSALKGREFSPGSAVPDHFGTISFAGVSQCVVRDNGYGPKGDSDYGSDTHYECVWDNSPQGRLEWLKNEVHVCFPDASYVDGTKNGTGGVFTINASTVAVEYASYGSLWISIR